MLTSPACETIILPFLMTGFDVMLAIREVAEETAVFCQNPTSQTTTRLGQTSWADPSRQLIVAPSITQEEVCLSGMYGSVVVMGYRWTDHERNATDVREAMQCFAARLSERLC